MSYKSGVREFELSFDHRPGEAQILQPPNSAQRHINLPKLKTLCQINPNSIQRQSLTLVNTRRVPAIAVSVRVSK